MAKQFTEVEIDGDFPMHCHIDDENLPPGIRPEDIAAILKENNPVRIVGQRTAIYEVLPDIFLRAKGCVYCPTVFAEKDEHELKTHDPLTLKRARSLGLRMAAFLRPIPERYLGWSGDFDFPLALPTGEIVVQQSPQRPFGAMTLDRAIRENTVTAAFRQRGYHVDLPAGYVEFPAFGFSDEGKDIPCGGFLSFIPNPYDLRMPEVLLHLPHNQELRELYQVESPVTFQFFHRVIECAAYLLRAIHDTGTTLTFPHSFNYKLGALDNEWKPRYQIQVPFRGSMPLVSICDLDAARWGEQNNLIFLADLLRDVSSLYELPHLLIGHPSDDPDDLKREIRVDNDDQRALSTIVARIPDHEWYFLPSPEITRTMFEAYFDRQLDDLTWQKLHLNPWKDLISHGCMVQEFTDDVTAYHLRDLFSLGVRGCTVGNVGPD